MKRSPAALVALPLAGALVLTGCGGQAPTPPTSSSTTATSSPTTTSPPSATSAPTTTAPTTDPNNPAAARAHTSAGAEAFVKHFYAQLNVAWSKPEAGLISVLSLPTCKTCANFEREAAKSVSNTERVMGQSVILDTVETSDATNPAKLTVVATGYQPKSIVVDAAGKTVQTLQRQRLRTLVTVQWSADGWRLAEIQSIT